MKPSFCAIASQQANEDLIGTAGHYQTYVLIECPMPWAAKVFNSKAIPPALRRYIKATKSDRSAQFLAIDRGRSQSAVVSDSVTLLVYERTVPSAVETNRSKAPGHESVSGYRGYEFQLDSLTQVIDCLEAHWQGDRIGQPITQQDLLVCTHGMRDKCCARFGQPFFREATRSAKQGNLPNTRVWQVSHIGGHRFAPTAISLPDGRYYGRLTLSQLQSIITRSGSVEDVVRSIYRGWGLLPAPLQVLERQLLIQNGWSWFDCKVTYRILSDPSSKGEASNAKSSQHELFVEIASHHPETKKTKTYWAKLRQDIQDTVCVKASCSSAVATPFVKYTVAECVLVNYPQHKTVSVK
ncbi:MAG: sucrase ferredoxin [Cyanobacteria bacterium J06555_13]